MYFLGGGEVRLSSCANSSAFGSKFYRIIGRTWHPSHTNSSATQAIGLEPSMHMSWEMASKLLWFFSFNKIKTFGEVVFPTGSYVDFNSDIAKFDTKRKISLS